MSDPSEWSDWNGQRGDSSPAVLAAFEQAIQKVGKAVRTVSTAGLMAREAAAGAPVDTGSGVMVLTRTANEDEEPTIAGGSMRAEAVGRFAVMATVACLALTRVDRGASRPVSQRLVLLATVAVMASGIVLLSSTGAVGRDAFGVADLALASALAGAVIVGQRKQGAARQSPAPTRRDGSSDHALPVT